MGKFAVCQFALYMKFMYPYWLLFHDLLKLTAVYYNQQNLIWELIPSDIDKANGTITFATNHFSTFAEFIQINGQDFTDKNSAFEYIDNLGHL